ncbi:DUF2125 domain-containing protein [Maritimibacter sp. UBA3975]|uniref:DUF2125 domain-containing protein n=1 Tax=Maritimibacter sp. UBA3975 TaxID=1946833 RepID=UPI000C0AABBF|nr:DUF2125 domain-containing protein [Maritimibacter sp. UBA3975]MAM63035.1 hypothetical protein [Maritimibacter sp.]|tara:strand:- start:33668 stop:34693 length:1026 start_codon:yes stop_codon:yes gene_type:complete
MRKAPQIIIALILLIFIGWGGYWVVGSQATERVLAGWFEDRRAEGWTAQYDSLNTAGFPSRFDTTITDLNIADPETGIAWSAPIFQNLSLSYSPTEVIAVLPGEQVFATRDASHRITSETFRASASFAPAVELPIRRSVIEIDGATIATTARGETRETGLEHAQISMRETPDRQGHVYDFDVNATGIRPDPALLSGARNAGAIPEVIDRARLTATVRFDNPWDRFAIERARPQPREIELTRLSVDWGALTLDATGVLVVGQNGVTEGEVDVKAENWRDMIAVAQAAGAVPEMLVGTITRAGEMLARLSGDPETLDATLRFENGRAFLGPVPLGPAPVIRLP